MSVTQAIERIKNTDLSWDELVAYLQYRNQSVRGTALYALAKRFGAERRTAELLRDLASVDEYQEVAMGTIRLSHVCVKLLGEIEVAEAKDYAEVLIRGWPEGDRSDLEWFLKNG